MRTRSVLSRALTIAAAGLLVACGDDPASIKPSPPSVSPFASIEVIGPDALFMGQSVQFVASIRQDDGTTKSATSMPNLRWRSSNPSVMSVSNSGMVTASEWGSGEAVITAEMTSSVTGRGTRTVVSRQRVTAGLEVSSQGTPGQFVFTLKLTESAGVSTTVTDLWLHFDAGWSGQCGWTAADLGQPRLPANGTFSLGPLTCPYFPFGGDIYLEVDVSLRDDNGHATRTFLNAVVR